ncbi:lysophospholipid acyltransferase family protein [Tranquillimonas alkanivorans]|uniref:KDO2-lipid IV(A) lauroyltransferase n=1 Tax=Tranquillimonas alkanivorans TaxID=441119 RepID=A0A1I5QV36_9RHOB|nr:lauroyl acyltransferase [Tranquillimonas alkanivorans]SFP49957.1 KDO2-lipid IV(A) lauroyltransferase [Tranquillimonas alkanivorans]
MGKKNRNVTRDRITSHVIAALLWGVLRIPYRVRVPMMGWLMARVVAPLLKWDRRIRDNLAHVMPDLPEAEVGRLTRAVPDNWGRTMIEIYSGAEFRRRLADTPLSGQGVEPMKQARAEGRPVILVTAHIGNFDALRAALSAQGYTLAGLYRPMRIEPFNTKYVKTLEENGPVFPADRYGVPRFVRHLANGGMVGILTDIYSSKGAPVTFFGKPAPTATSVCQWALNHDALLIPIYGIRRPDGLNFDLITDAPVAHSDPVTMTQELNDLLERQVRSHMDQWFWIHRRWKPESQSTRAAATTGP